MFEADCSGFAPGGCFIQRQNSKFRKPVAYHSYKQTGPEMNYELYDKELLGILACMKEWDAELRG